MTSREALPKHSVLVSAHLRAFVFFWRDGRRRADEWLRAGDRTGNQVSTAAQNVPRALRASQPWLVPSLRGAQRSTVPPTHAQLSILQSKQPRTPPFGWPQWVPLSKSLLGLTPALRAAGQQARRGVCLVPSSASARPPWGSLWGRGPAECDLLSSGWI